MEPRAPPQEYFQQTSRAYHERHVALLNEKATTWKAKVRASGTGWVRAAARSAGILREASPSRGQDDP